MVCSGFVPGETGRSWCVTNVTAGMVCYRCSSMRTKGERSLFVLCFGSGMRTDGEQNANREGGDGLVECAGCWAITPA